METNTCPNPNCKNGVIYGHDQYGRDTAYPCTCAEGSEMADARELAAFDAEVVAPAEQGGRMVLASWPLPISETNYRAAVNRINALNARWNEAALLARLVSPIDYEAEDAALDAWLEDAHDLRSYSDL
jgi:hypothetical protein